MPTVGENAVVMQWRTTVLQLIAFAIGKVVHIDRQIQLIGWSEKGIAKPQCLMVEGSILSVIKYIEVGGRQFDQLSAVDFSMLGLDMLAVDFINIAKKSQWHIGVDGCLVLDEHYNHAVKDKGDVILRLLQKLHSSVLIFTLYVSVYCVPLQGIGKLQEVRLGADVAAERTVSLILRFVIAFHLS